ncbi:hypothetical protein PPYR_11344 [Photinus pyralis]|uniref:Uncharacterized protein n=1 Tax=Photinus pyralis TaxID=7054 RepID=A0A5N4AAZ8_PHOPY|nr:uncharacterized protein LOC116175544 [Photinus pyralis]KAB0794505.1 hypothetical protein PPYR_11344 [Photinus pyralis]
MCMNHKMYSRWPIFTICAITMSCGRFVLGASFQDCLRKDSISCLQMQVYRTAKSIVSNESISLADGIMQIRLGNDSQSLALEENYDKLFGKTEEVEERQTLLETYLMEVVESLWKRRTVSFSYSRAAEILASWMPNSLKDKLENVISQGRGKNKKLKKYVRLIVGAKLILVTLAAVVFIFVVVIAKKALLAGVVSLLLLGYGGLADLMNPKLVIKPDIIAYDTGTDWQPPYANYEDLTMTNSEPAPHQKMIIGHTGT